MVYPRSHAVSGITKPSRKGECRDILRDALAAASPCRICATQRITGPSGFPRNVAGAASTVLFRRSRLAFPVWLYVRMYATSP